MLTALTQGGIPTSPDMLSILTSFMHLLTLNGDAKQLLLDSGLLRKFFGMCMQPERYHRFIQQRRRDELNSE